MALATFADFKSLCDTAIPLTLLKNGVSGSNSTNRARSTFLSQPNAGSAPSTAVTCDATLAGAALFPSIPGSRTNALYIAQLEGILGSFNGGQGADSAGMIWLVDRLSHQGGLVSNSTGTQTTNLPTAALTRYTNGVGVMAAVQCYSSSTGTGTTATITYTNSAGTGSRVSKAFSFGSVTGGSNDAGKFLIVPLADGDVGVKSVESLTAASLDATAGNFGITLFKPLISIPCVGTSLQGGNAAYWNGILGNGGSIIEVADDAFLDIIHVNAQSLLGAGFSAKFIEVA